MESGPLTFAALLAGTLARWRTVLTVAVIVVLVALALSFVLPPSYRGSASFVTADASVELPRGLAELATDPGLAGVASQLGVGSSRDPSHSPAFYAQLLRSRELRTRLVQSRFPDPRTDDPRDSANLVQLFGIRHRDSLRAVEVAVRRLEKKMEVVTDPRTSFLFLEVDARWPTLAADIANSAVGLVSAFNKEQRLSRAQGRREFLETRVRAAEEELRDAENGLRTFYQTNRLWEDSPALVVEERRHRRQVETASTLYLSLRREYEAARIDEVNTTPVITIVDRAVPPRRPEWPRRIPILITAMVLGGILGLLWAAAREVLANWARRHPGDAGLLRSTAARIAGEVAGTLPRRRRAGG
ncbi:MAG: GNVR domain-containing protein [Gemmatimonadales bacterium]